MHFFRSRTGLFAVGGLILVAVLVAAGAVMLTGAPEPTPTPAPTDAVPTPSPTPLTDARPRRPPRVPSPSPTPVAVCPMNGHQARRIRRWPRRVPILVQIENNPIARPPSGLNLADLVIEAPVEGDTTRFTAVFMCDRARRGGGRSGSLGALLQRRLLAADRAVTFHFGGAGKVLARFNSEGMPYANGLTGGWGVLLPGRAVGGAAQRLLRRRCGPRGARGRVPARAWPRLPARCARRSRSRTIPSCPTDGA